MNNTSTTTYDCLKVAQIVGPVEVINSLTAVYDAILGDTYFSPISGDPVLVRPNDSQLEFSCIDLGTGEKTPFLYLNCTDATEETPGNPVICVPTFNYQGLLGYDPTGLVTYDENGCFRPCDITDAIRCKNIELTSVQYEAEIQTFCEQPLELAKNGGCPTASPITADYTNAAYFAVFTLGQVPWQQSYDSIANIVAVVCEGYQVTVTPNDLCSYSLTTPIWTLNTTENTAYEVTLRVVEKNSPSASPFNTSVDLTLNQCGPTATENTNIPVSIPLANESTSLEYKFHVDNSAGVVSAVEMSGLVGSTFVVADVTTPISAAVDPFLITYPGLDAAIAAQLALTMGDSALVSPTIQACATGASITFSICGGLPGASYTVRAEVVRAPMMMAPTPPGPLKAKAVQPQVAAVKSAGKDLSALAGGKIVPAQPQRTGASSPGKNFSSLLSKEASTPGKVVPVQQRTATSSPGKNLDALLSTSPPKTAVVEKREASPKKSLSSLLRNASPTKLGSKILDKLKKKKKEEIVQEKKTGPVSPRKDLSALLSKSTSSVKITQSQ